MNAASLTKTNLKKFIREGLPEGKSSAMLWADAPKGLGVRLRSSGSASWVYVYRPRGVGRGQPSRTVTIGRESSLTLKQAQAAAAALAGDVALQRDPAVERRAERLRDKSSVAKVLDGFAAQLAKREIVARVTIMNTLRRELASLSKREVGTLQRKELVALIDKVEASGRPGAADNLRRNARSMLEFAVDKGLAQHNVLAGLRRPRASRAERLDDGARGRALDDHEIAALWISAEGLGPFGGVLRLALLTGFRRSELGGLRWSDIEADRLVIEAHAAKTGARHEAPASPLMLAVLAAQPRTTSPFVFPGRSGRRMTGWSKLVPRAQRLSGIEFRLHDLRRTCRTLMSRLGVAEEIAELAIGHTRRGLVGTYNRDQAWGARIEAFERVSAHVAQIVKS